MEATARGLDGAMMNIAIGAVAAFGLSHALPNVDYYQIFAVTRATDVSTIAVALLLVTVTYGRLADLDQLLRCSGCSRRDHGMLLVWAAQEETTSGRFC